MKIPIMMALITLSFNLQADEAVYNNYKLNALRSLNRARMNEAHILAQIKWDESWDNTVLLAHIEAGRQRIHSLAEKLFDQQIIGIDQYELLCRMDANNKNIQNTIKNSY